jgi:hypothetical protein
METGLTVSVCGEDLGLAAGKRILCLGGGTSWSKRPATALFIHNKTEDAAHGSAATVASQILRRSDRPNRGNETSNTTARAEHLRAKIATRETT